MPRCPGSCSSLMCTTSACNLSLTFRAGGATALTVVDNNLLVGALPRKVDNGTGPHNRSQEALRQSPE
eukprot:42203-Prorocentrum_lima.AAC.1